MCPQPQSLNCSRTCVLLTVAGHAKRNAVAAFRAPRSPTAVRSHRRRRHPTYPPRSLVGRGLFVLAANAGQKASAQITSQEAVLSYHDLRSTADIEQRLSYHPASSPERQAQHDAVRAACKRLTHALDRIVRRAATTPWRSPPSRSPCTG